MGPEWTAFGLLTNVAARAEDAAFRDRAGNVLDEERADRRVVDGETTPHERRRIETGLDGKGVIVALIERSAFTEAAVRIQAGDNNGVSKVDPPEAGVVVG